MNRHAISPNRCVSHARGSLIVSTFAMRQKPAIRSADVAQTLSLPRPDDRNLAPFPLRPPRLVAAPLSH